MQQSFWSKAFEYAKVQQAIEDRRLKLWHVTRTDECGYDEYDSFVIAAPTEEDARHHHPMGYDMRLGSHIRFYGDWIVPERCDTLIVKQIGIASEDIEAITIIVASHNAG